MSENIFNKIADAYNSFRKTSSQQDFFIVCNTIFEDIKTRQNTAKNYCGTDNVFSVDTYYNDFFKDYQNLNLVVIEKAVLRCLISDINQKLTCQISEEYKNALNFALDNLNEALCYIKFTLVKNKKVISETIEQNYYENIEKEYMLSLV